MVVDVNGTTVKIVSGRERRSGLSAMITCFNVGERDLILVNYNLSVFTAV